MSKMKKVMLSVNELITEITGRDSVLKDRQKVKEYFKRDDWGKLCCILTEDILTIISAELHGKLLGPTLKDMMNAHNGETKSAVVSARKALAEAIHNEKNGFDRIGQNMPKFEELFGDANLKTHFSLDALPGVNRFLLGNPVLLTLRGFLTGLVPKTM